MSQDIRFDRKVERGYFNNSPDYYFDKIKKLLEFRQVRAKDYTSASDDDKQIIKEDIQYINQKIKHYIL